MEQESLQIASSRRRDAILVSPTFIFKAEPGIRSVQDDHRGPPFELYNHDCAKACYLCMKSYRNQPFHGKLDKTLIRDVLFQLSSGEMIGQPFSTKRGEGIKLSEKWISENVSVPTRDTAIEKMLAETIRRVGRLPAPVPQREFRSGENLLTVADFAYEEEKIAIYCDGFAYHGGRETLEKDATKRNELQAEGWAVLTFWGKTILRHPERCEEQIWRVFQARRKKEFANS